MRLLGPSVVLAAVVAAAICPAPAPAQDETVLAVEQKYTDVTALDDVAAWSSYDPAIDRYWLVTSTGGAPPRRLPLRSRAVPFFDADLGRDGDGQLVLAYSRCPLEAEGGLEDCRLYRYRLGDRREHRVDSGRWPGASDFLPSMWRGRMAFIRKGRPPGAPRLRRLSGYRLIVRSLKSGRERVVPLPRGPVGRDAAGRIPTVVDLAGPRLLSGWSYEETECRRKVPVGDDDKIAPEGSEVFRGTARRLRRIAEGCDTDPVQAVLAPAQLGRRSFSLDRIRRITERRTYSPSGEVLASRPIPGGEASSLAVARSGTYYTSRAFDPATGFSYRIVRTPR